MSTCSVLECSSRVVAHGLCDRHYRRKRKGQPMEPPVVTWDDIECALRTRVADSIADLSPDICWEWKGKTNSVGRYGLIFAKLDGKTRTFLVHRLMYGTVPDGLQLDHLCRNTVCCNPWHLDPVTHGENVRRYTATITHCPRGHAYDDMNTAVHNRRRVCLTCRADDKWLRDHPEASLDDPRRRGRYARP